MVISKVFLVKELVQADSPSSDVSNGQFGIFSCSNGIEGNAISKAALSNIIFVCGSLYTNDHPSYSALGLRSPTRSAEIDLRYVNKFIRINDISIAEIIEKMNSQILSCPLDDRYRCELNNAINVQLFENKSYKLVVIGVDRHQSVYEIIFISESHANEFVRQFTECLEMVKSNVVLFE